MKKIFAFAAMAALLLFSCGKDDENNPSKPDNGKDDNTPVSASITIDGDFSDWEALGRKGCVYAICDPDARWDAVEEIRVCADKDYIFYYIRFNRDVIADYLAENDVLPCRINLNTDNEFESGYANYFLQAYDFIFEGELGDGNGGWGFYDADLNQRIDGVWVELSKKGAGLTDGAGSGVEYEISLDRAEFNAVASKSAIPMPIGDVVQTSLRFYETVTNPNWAELSNMPNGPDDENEGYADLLELNL